MNIAERIEHICDSGDIFDTTDFICDPDHMCDTDHICDTTDYICDSNYI